MDFEKEKKMKFDGMYKKHINGIFVRVGFSLFLLKYLKIEV